MSKSGDKFKSKRIINEVPVEKILKAFANKNRIAILEFLDKYPESTLSDISDELEIEIKNCSAHITKLSTAGLLIKKYQSINVIHKLTKRGSIILSFVRMLE